MKLIAQLPKVFSQSSKFADLSLVAVSLCAILTSTGADAATPLTSDLWSQMGVSAILLGGGRGHVTDASAADSNPAGIALQKTYTVGGEMGWTGQKSRQAEAAACDSTTSELAACFKFRQTQAVTGAKDRRFTLGLAEELSQAGGLILGLAGDYVQYAEDRAPDAILPPASKTGQRLRLGAIYKISEGLFLGGSSDGLYDTTDTARAHGVGFSLQGGRYFVFNGDFNFAADALSEMVAGMTIFPRDFLDLALSYGYDPRSSQHNIAAGLVVKSQQARLLYSVVRSNALPSKWIQRVGIGFFMAGDAGAR